MATSGQDKMCRGGHEYGLHGTVGDMGRHDIASDKMKRHRDQMT